MLSSWAVVRTDDPRSSPPGEQAPGPLPEVQDALDTSGGRRLVCAACGELVTTEYSAISVNDHHDHTFVNPAGFVFKIGCFEQAPGCRSDGAASEHWTWFPGFSWQATSCRGCGVLLGWMFRSTAQTFFGLILERLAESDEQGPSTPG